MAESSESGDDVVPLNEETQIALPSDENEGRLALPVVIPSFKLSKGTFDRANFGPQRNTKHVEANTIEHATITNVHHHYGGANKSEESSSTSDATGARPKQKLEKGFIQITDNIFMNPKKPLKEGLKIYEGYQEHVTGQRQPLAIKAIFPCTKKSIREVQHLVTLTPHPNVVRIICSKEQETPLPALYIAMELCSSKNLHDYLNENRDKNTPLDFKKTMSYSKRLVKAMKHIHRNRIIHGDLKPENILFSLDGDKIKVSDFGISRLLRHSHNTTKITSRGTDGYRAPETYNSEVISMMADIFSLGVTLYSLWTNGKHPYGEDSDLWMFNIKKNRGRDLSGLPEEMGDKKAEFLDLLDKMLQVDPENRPTIEEISQHPFLSVSQATAQDPGHLHRMASSSDPRDDIPWTKKLCVLNIPGHLSSYKILRNHFERFGRLEECVMTTMLEDKRTFASITFCNHDDALAAKYGAVSAGPDHNLVIKWDDIEASFTRQLNLETSPKEALLELQIVAPTTPESSLAFEETRPKEAREVIMQGLDLWLENSPEETTHVFASVETRPKEDPGHLYRMTSSSGPRDDDPWRKKLRVTNIPRHLSSYKALRHHFERFGELEELYRNDKRKFVCITFRNHHNALAARYGAVSAGPHHNLVIKWDVKEGPAVNVADSYPSSEIPNTIVDGIDARRNNYAGFETLGKMINLGMDIQKRNVWRVFVKADENSTTSVIPNMDRGCRIGSFYLFPETRFQSEKVKINGEERLISELDMIQLQSGLLSQRELVIVVWYDHETMQLYANNPTSFDVIFRKTSNLDSKSNFSPLSKKTSVPIFSIKEFVDLIESKKREGEQVTGEEGVEINIPPLGPVYIGPVFKILIIPEGILQFQ